MAVVGCFLGLLPMLLLTLRVSAAEPTAAAVDAALGRSTLPLADDATFLRRISLDLTGKLPEPDAATRFVADASPTKRAKIVEELLRSEAYAINCARYWRDTVTYPTPA